MNENQDPKTEEIPAATEPTVPEEKSPEAPAAVESANECCKSDHAADSPVGEGANECDASPSGEQAKMASDKAGHA